MNDELSVQEKVIIELHSRKLLDIIVDVCCEYHSCPRISLRNVSSLHAKYVRNTILYISHCVYGMQIGFVGKIIKSPYSTAFNGVEKLRESLNEIGVQTDINNIRTILVKTLNETNNT